VPRKRATPISIRATSLGWCEGQEIRENCATCRVLIGDAASPGAFTRIFPVWPRRFPFGSSGWLRN
jgi:hypothetical protein